MNGALRVKGWTQVDTMLENWTDSWSEQRSKLEWVNHLLGENDIPTRSFISTEVDVDANWEDSTYCVQGRPSFVAPELFIETGYYYLYNITKNIF